jgi:hypothetical protein
MEEKKNRIVSQNEVAPGFSHLFWCSVVAFSLSFGTKTGH